MASKGVSFSLIREDAEDRGINLSTLVSSVEQISRAQLPDLLGQYDSI